MSKTILGIFSDRLMAEKAINMLKDANYDPKDLSIIMKDKAEGEKLAEDTGTDVVGGAVTGATTGAVLGGLAGILASFVIPGLGAFFIGGPVATALGLTGAAATTATGATTGAIAGGLLGALTGFGLSEDEALIYEERIKTGGILVAVPARSGEERQVEQILTECNADEIKSVSSRESKDRIINPISSKSSDTNVDYGSESSAYHAYSGAKGGKAGNRKNKGNGLIGGSEETEKE